MKIVLSRKGFDVENGGMASPIMPDGTLLSLPIPSWDHDCFSDLRYQNKTYQQIIDELKPGRGYNCHIDPDIRISAHRHLPKDWVPVFGQCDAAETHLENQGIKEGDVFLFFGWFKQTEEKDGKLSFVKGAPDLHVIYGYLQIGKIARGNELADYLWHPHSVFLGGNNTMYIASEHLIIDGKDTGLPGAGTFKYSEQLVLTYPGMTRTRWKLPEYFKDVSISYHTADSFKPEGYFQSAHKGQEFVVSESKKVTNWTKRLIAENVDLEEIKQSAEKEKVAFPKQDKDIIIVDDRDYPDPFAGSPKTQKKPKEKKEKPIPDWYETYNEMSRKMLENNLDSGTNIVASPLSFYVLMTMSLNAAGSKCRKEIKDAICPSATSIKSFTKEIKQLQDSFLKNSKDEKVLSSNAFYMRKFYEKHLLKEYRELLEKSFKTTVFSQENAVDTINSWVNEKTDGMIKNIISEQPRDLLFLNALAFDAKWKKKYDVEDIEDDCFLDFKKNETDITMLYSSEHDYIESRDFIGFTKDYKGDHFAFMALLPKMKSKAFFERAVKKIDFKGLYESRTEAEVSAGIPEFKLDNEINLMSLCNDMGIKGIFCDKADLSGMAKEIPLKVGEIKQKAFLSVDRSGTKAAAVTQMVVCAGCVPDMDEYKYVILNRPFVYAIVHKESGLPIFTGFVTEM